MLAEWLSRQRSPASAALPLAARRALRGCRLWGDNHGTPAGDEDGAAPQGGASTSWGGATAVELGVGLGLPSIVAHSLGMKVRVRVRVRVRARARVRARVRARARVKVRVRVRARVRVS